MNRRSFIRNSALLAASLSALPHLGCRTPKPTERIRGANGDIRVAVAGFNGRGMSHIQGFEKIKGVRIVALCDVDEIVLDKGVKTLTGRGHQVKGYRDIRKLIEDPNIDAIGFATPNHWHALGAIWAIQAGKDVYVEKPVSHNVWEGRKIVEAARKYRRIVQTGTQSRSSYGMREAFEWVQAGNMGKILRARGLCYKNRPSIGKVDGPQPIPPSIDYDLWCGPAPKEPLMRKKLHYDWHWVWPTGNGDLGNQGVHQMDMCRWALGINELSPSVLSIGGRLGYVDDGTTPNTQIVFHDYKPAPLIFEVRGLPTDPYRGAHVGAVVDCEGGSLLIKSYSGATALDKDGQEIKKFEGADDHFANFITAVRSRSVASLNADILEGHLSAALCHTANISYLLGKKQSPDEMKDAVKNNPDMAETLARMEEHLAARKVDLQKTPATLGAVLKMDPLTERFIGNSAADKLLTRQYRKPYVVPEKV